MNHCIHGHTNNTFSLFQQCLCIVFCESTCNWSISWVCTLLLKLKATSLSEPFECVNNTTHSKRDRKEEEVWVFKVRKKQAGINRFRLLPLPSFLLQILSLKRGASNSSLKNSSTEDLYRHSTTPKMETQSTFSDARAAFFAFVSRWFSFWHVVVVENRNNYNFFR